MGKFIVLTDIKNYWCVLILNIFIGVKLSLFLSDCVAFMEDWILEVTICKIQDYQCVILECKLVYPLVVIFKVPRH